MEQFVAVCDKNNEKFYLIFLVKFNKIEKHIKCFCYSLTLKYFTK